MAPNISYEGPTMNCKVATVHADEDLQYATRELMHSITGVVAVRLKEYLSPADVESALEAVSQMTIAETNGMISKRFIHLFGSPQQGYRGNPEAYFQDAEPWRHNEAFNNLVGPDSPIVKRIINTFQTAFGREMRPGKYRGRPLLPATVRNVQYSELHRDTVGRKASESWEDLNKLQHDIGWNVYVSMPSVGGELRIYPDETRHTQGAVEDYPYVKIRPEVGELIYFRSGIPHSVDASSDKDGKRLSINGSLGFEPAPSKIIRYWA